MGSKTAFIFLNRFAGHLPRISRKLLGGLFGSYYETILEKLRPSEIMQIACQGSLMYVDTRDDSIARYLLTEGVWEPYETELMKQSIKPHMIFVDIGANMGYYTLLAARLMNGTGKVVAIEPISGNLRLLSLSVQANAYTNVIAVQEAVSNRAARTKLFFDQKNCTIVSFSEDNLWAKGGGFVYVNTMTLDSLLSDLEIEKVDVMKIDVEGAEGLVFEGGRKIFRYVNKIFMEFKPQALRNLGTDPEKLTKQLIHGGFEISLIDEKNRRCIPVGQDYNSLLRLHEVNLLLES